MTLVEGLFIRSHLFSYQQECDNCSFRPLSHEMYLQKVNKNSLPPLDDERCYINIFESKLYWC